MKFKPEIKLLNFQCPTVNKKVKIVIKHYPAPSKIKPKWDCLYCKQCPITTIKDGEPYTNYDLCSFKNQ
jgi:hypothetical protein